MKILVTGGSGFIGSHLIKGLRKRFIDIVPSIHNMDLKVGEDIRTAPLPEADVVFHLAAMVVAQTEDAEADASTNIMGTLRLAEHYRHNLIYASSCAVNYPYTPYGISKMCGEKYVRLFNGKVVRLCNVWGPGGHGVVEAFRGANQLKIAGKGDQQRTYAHVDTVVDAFISAYKTWSNILVRGPECTVLDIADKFNKPRIFVDQKIYDLADGRQKCGEQWMREIICDKPIY